MLLFVLLFISQVVPPFESEDTEFLKVSAEPLQIRGGETKELLINIERTHPETVFHPEESPPVVRVKSAPERIVVEVEKVRLETTKDGLLLAVPITAGEVKEERQAKIELEIEIFYCKGVEWCRRETFPCTVDVRLLPGEVSYLPFVLYILAVVGGVCVAVSAFLGSPKLLFAFCAVEALFLLAVAFNTGQHTTARNVAEEL